MTETATAATAKLPAPDEAVRRMFGAIGIDASLYGRHDQIDHGAVRDLIRDVAGPVAAAVLRDFAAHAEAEFNDDERGTDYARGVLDAARNARRRADLIDPA